MKAEHPAHYRDALKAATAALQPFDKQDPITVIMTAHNAVKPLMINDPKEDQMIVACSAIMATWMGVEGDDNHPMSIWGWMLHGMFDSVVSDVTTAGADGDPEDKAFWAEQAEKWEQSR